MAGQRGEKKDIRLSAGRSSSGRKQQLQGVAGADLQGETVDGLQGGSGCWEFQWGLAGQRRREEVVAGSRVVAVN